MISNSVSTLCGQLVLFLSASLVGAEWLQPGGGQPNAIMAEEDHLAGRVQRVAELIEGFETPHGMELLGSVHWLTQENVDAKASWEVSFTELQNWNERKRRIFPIPHVRVAFGPLKLLNWI